MLGRGKGGSRCFDLESPGETRGVGQGRVHLLRLSCYSTLQDNGCKSTKTWGILTGDTWEGGFGWGGLSRESPIFSLP